MTRYDLYGWQTMPLDRAQEVLRKRLGVRFTARESSYLGDYYASTRELDDGKEEILIQENHADENGELIEADFPQHATLVYVNGSDRWEDLDPVLASVEGLQLLRSEHIE